MRRVLKPAGILAAILAVLTLIWAGVIMAEMSSIDSRIAEFRKDFDENAPSPTGQEPEQYKLHLTELMNSNLEMYNSSKSGRNLMAMVGFGLGIVSACCLTLSRKQSMHKQEPA